MNQPTSAPAIDGDGIREVLRFAHALRDPEEIHNDDGEVVGRQYLVPAGYGIQTVDLRPYRDRPARKQGHVDLDDASSFVAYVATHAKPGTHLYANRRTSTVRAVLNSDTRDNPGWSDHTAALILRHTPEWERWSEINGKWQNQIGFAEFVEESSPDFRKPTAAHMLEIAQTFEAKTGVEFQSGARLDNGERQLVYKETVTAKAGQSGSLEIPAQVEIGLRPYEGGPGYNLLARLRYRITGGELSLMFKIDRAEEVLDLAFTETVTGIRDSLDEVPDLLVVHGTRR